MDDALAMRVGQADSDFLEKINRMCRGEGAVATQQVIERALLDILHDIVGRLAVPTHVEELHDVAIGRQEAELFDLSRQE